MELNLEKEIETVELKSVNGYVLSKAIKSKKYKLYLEHKGIRIRLPLFIAKIFCRTLVRK